MWHSLWRWGETYAPEGPTGKNYRKDKGQDIPRTSMYTPAPPRHKGGRECTLLRVNQSTRALCFVRLGMKEEEGDEQKSLQLKNCSSSLQVLV